VFPWHKFEVGSNSIVEDYCTINNGAGDVIIGSNARVGIGSVIIGPVFLGDKVGLGQHVFISGFNHGYEDGGRDSNEQELVRKPIIIGDEAHIGANSVVVAGVKIGKRVQVGAGSVVTKDIPAYSVAVGNPARVIKRYDFEKKEWVKA
jgi:acetyltransferase-like isoleucine patch superfamily enzyme